MKIVLIGVVGLALCAAAAMAWQHWRYLQIRRELVQDRQPMLYASDAFHVVSFLRVEPSGDVVEALRKLRASTESFEGVRWIYAGKVALNGLHSNQMGEVDWSAVVVIQYPSQEAYARAALSETHRQAFSGFAEHYSHGMQRGAGFNLMLPQVLLARRVAQILRREPSSFPFVRVPDEKLERIDEDRIAALLSEPELGARAVAVVNLIRHGTPEQRARDAEYAGRMLGAMAEGGYGPMHMGRAVALPGGHDFDRVAIVFYPGVRFFADMARSEFFQGIIGDKQLGDSQSSITVPLLERL